MPAVHTVVLTRQRDDNRALADRLEAAGVRVVESPCLEIVYVRPSDDEAAAVLAVDTWEAAVFSSRHGVQGYFAWREGVPPLRKVPRPRLVAAVGQATAEALMNQGLTVDLVAAPATGEALAAALLLRLMPGSRILAPRGTLSRDAAANSLREAGCPVYPLTVYENREPEIAPLREPVDAVVLASPSAVRRFFAANPGLKGACAVAIGPATAAALAERGIPVVQAEGEDGASLAAAVLRILKAP